MKFNKKYCLLFLMTVLVLLLGAGMVSASEAGSDVQVVKDNQGLSTPDNYDVDNVVQSDKVLTKSEANVEKTSTKDDTKNNNESSIDTFVDTDNTNEDLQTIASGSGHSAKVSVNEISGRTLNIAGLENSGLLQETIDVGKISVSSYDSLAGSEDMTPILTSETTDSSVGLVDTNTKSSVKSQETEKTIEKADGYQDVKVADGDSTTWTVKVTWSDFNDKYGGRPDSVDIGLLVNNVLDSSTIVTLNKEDYGTSNTWNYTFKDLPRLVDGNTLTYRGVLVNRIPDYTNTSSHSTYSNTTTFTATYDYTDWTVNVIWSDFNDKYGGRPDSVDIGLLVNNVLDSSTIVTLNKEDYGTSNTWNYTFEHLPVYRSGTTTKNTYKGTLINRIPGYGNTTTSISYGSKITATYDYTDWTVNVSWVDRNNKAGMRPDSVDIGLLVNNVLDSSTIVTLNKEDYGTSNTWNYTFEHLPTYRDGTTNAITYKGTLLNPITDYTNATTQYSTYFTSKITATYDYTDWTVNITWSDYNDNDGKRPSSVDVELVNYQTGARIDMVTMTSDMATSQNRWTYTFQRLPIKSGTQTISYAAYKVSEIPYYTNTTSRSSTYNTTTLTLTHKKDTVNLTIIKLWDDADDNDGCRPTSIKVNIYNGTSLLKQQTIYASNNWRYNIKYDKYTNGQENTFTVDENSFKNYTLVSVISTASDEYVVSNVNYTDLTFNLTNKHIPETRNITVTKVWEDYDNRDNIRPESVSVTLTADGEVLESYRSVVLSEANGWNHTYINLPKFINKRKIVYDFVEENVPEGYNYSVTYSGDNYVVHNGFTYITVKKVWEDYDNEDNLRPESVTLTLTANGETIKTFVLNDNNNWYYEHEDRLPRYDSDGIKIRYSFEEDGDIPEEYSSIIEMDDDYNFVIHNGYVHVTVQKEWIDSNDVNNKRPDNITVTLYGDTPYYYAYQYSAVLNDTNGWYYDFGILPKYDKRYGFKIQNIIKEEVPEGYGYSISSENDKYTIKNYYLRDLNVKVIWDDGNNKFSSRPEIIMLYLNGDGECVNSGYYYDGNNWERTFKVAKYNEDGAEIEYSIEQTLPEYYSSKVEQDVDTITVTNSYISDVSMIITKNWDDFEDIEGFRPDNITVQILANGEVYKDVILTEENGWYCEIKQLPKFDSEDNPIDYSIREIVPDRYQEIDETIETHTDEDVKSYINLEVLSFTEDKVVFKVYVTNLSKDIISTGRITIKDSEGTVILQNENLNEGYVTFERPTEDFNGQIMADKIYDISSKTLGEFSYDISFSGNGEYDSTESTISSSDILIYNTMGSKLENPFNMEGILSYCINYGDPDPVSHSLLYPDGSESSIPYYKVALTDEKFINKKDGADVTDYIRTFIYYATSDDDFDIINDGRTFYQVLGLYLGEGYADMYGHLDYKDPQTLLDWSSWVEGNATKAYNLMTTVNNLVDSGNAMPNHGIIEANSDGTLLYQIYILHEAIYGLGFQNLLGIEYTFVPKEVKYQSEITNTHIPEKTNISVIKNWTDDDNKVGLRPDHVVVQLYANGEVFGNPVILSEDNDWTYNFTDLNVYIDGEKIEYTVKELYVPANYTETYNYTVNITISHEGKTSSDDVVSANIELLANGVVVDSIEIENIYANWNHTFTGFPVYDASTNELIDYTVSEIDVDYNMTCSYAVSIDNTITGTTNIQVTKKWDDNDNQDGIRPTEITVALYIDVNENGSFDEDDELVDILDLNEDNEWTDSFEELPMYDENGVLIKYAVDEVIFEQILRGRNFGFRSEAPMGYTYEISEESENNFIITNTHIPDKTNISIIKSWTDDNDKVGLRPDSITVQLYANGVEEGSPVVLEPDEDGVWRYDFIDLDLYYDHGTPISYTVEEVVSDDYVETHNFTVNITISSLGMDVPEEIEPESRVIYLLADGEKVDSVEIDNIFEKWSHTFTDLPVYNDSDELINYTFAVEYEGKLYVLDPYYQYNMTCNYSVSINNRITGIRTVTVSKVWDDANNQDGKRPDEVTVELVVDGVPSGQTLTLTGPEFEEKFENLPMYHLNGTLIVYNVTEVESEYPDGYTFTSVVSCDGGFKVINTHVPENISVNVTKVWKDENDNDRVRPANVTVILLQNGEEFRTVVLNATGGWKYTFNNLPKYYDEGKEYVYNVTEVAVSGYTMSVSNNSAYNFTITNSHELELTELNVTKVWNDSDNQDGLRVPEVHVILMDDAEEIRDTYLNAGNGWKYTFTELVKYRDGKLIEYTLVEDDVDDYDTEIVFNNGVFTVTNTHIPENISVNVTKVWTDNENQDGVRPANVTVKLLQNGEEYKTVVLSEDNEWYYLFENLPKFHNNGNITKYEIVEVAVPGYTTVVSNVSTEFTVNNTHVPENTSVNVSKVWNDADNNDAVRPNNVTITLVIDGVVSDNKVQINSTNWNYTFENLPKYRDNGVLINYNVTEDAVEDYTTEIVFCEGRFKVINTHVPEVVNKTVNKLWNDDDNRDNMRPSKVTIKLKSNDGNEYVAVIEEVNGKWNYTFTDLPKYSNGKELVYTVEESVVPDGYDVEYDQDTLTITNTHEFLTKEINVVKVWDDADTAKDRPENITVFLVADDEVVANLTLTGDKWTDKFADLPVYKEGEVGVEIVYSIKELTVANYTTVITNISDEWTITNTHIPELVDITINKVWNDNNNQDALRTNVTIILKAEGVNVQNGTVQVNSTDDWTYTFSNLPKYANGKEIVYTIEEVVPYGYTVTIEGYTITNTHEVYTKEINVTKVWNDNNDNDNARMDVVVELLADGEKVDETTLNEGNSWKDTFKDLPVNKDGKSIVYTIKEVNVEHYITNITECNGNFIITNTLVPELVNVTVYKVWNDSNNQDGIRPEEVTLKLKADGQEYTVKVVKSTGGKWNYTFTDLPKYNAGKEIVYTVEEVNIANGYTVTYSEDTLSIVNTHIPETTNVNVVKDWDDNNNNDGKRPGSVTVELLADGVVVDTAVLDESNDWKYTFDELAKYANGKLIVYNISESDVPEGYTVKVVFCEGVFKVVNSYVPENTTITVTKEWLDNNDQDGIRPASVTVQVFADGEEYRLVELTARDGWTLTVTGLPKYSNGHEIVYSVGEVGVSDGYLAVLDGLNIINIHLPELTEVNVSKVWDDNNNNDGKRPGSVTVELLADGVVVDTAVLDESNDWKYTFDELAKYANGKLIVYNISESDVPEGYTVKVVFCEGVFKVVNSYVPENTSIDISKVWDDADNQDAIRPESIFISILANGEEYKLVKLTSENDWSITVTGLPKYSNGEEIVYTVEEASVPDGYAAVVDGLTITNTHVPEVTSINVTKVWKDNNNNDGVRPESVTVNLLADGVKYASATLNEGNNWKYTFDNLPLNKEGRKVIYTVTEDGVEGYITTLVNCNGTFKFINTHDDSKVNITINKVWEDNNNQDAIRPNNVTVEVLANGERYDVVVINSTSNWKITVEDLPEFIDGQKVVYTVCEIRVETGYTSSVDGLTITNTHEPFTKEINVTKIWNDNNNNALRPESVTVHLMDGNKVVATAILSADNDWKVTFKDLPVNKDGKAIVYTVKEVEVPDYRTEVKDCCGNFKIVNTPIAVPINITVNKVWNDNNNNDGIRPDSVTIRLLADGEMVEVAVITGDDWTYTFENLPEYKDGKKVIYTVEEVEVPSGYVESVDGLTITNTHVDITKNITVSKFWDDDNNNDGIRPDSVTIHLLADGNEVETTTLSADNDWKDTFKDLPVNKDGKAIVYTVTEDSVDSYATSITNVGDEFIITNSYNITKINLTVNKVWNDSNDNDGIRPDNITVILYADGEELVAAVVNEDDDWTYTFSDLPKYNNGYLIEYTIDELPIEEYYAVVDGLTITNTHNNITKDIPVSKVWVDDDNNDGVRPDSVTFNLYAFGKKVSSIVITEADGWEGVFKDLPVYIDGNEIVYTIVEESVPDYWVTYNGNVIINTHDLVNTSVTVTKVWNDSSNNDGVRPDSVSVNLYANGVKVNSTLLSSNNSWTYTFDKLPKYDDGQIIDYTVDEEVVDAYTTTITEDSNYFIITNNHEIELINLTINKVWDDKDNLYGKRPVNVTINVFVDGEQNDSVVLSEENNWTCELTDLPKYNNGELIKYNVDEVNITYYHYSIEANDDYSFTVTNTLNNVRVFKWAWKLIGWNESYYEHVEEEYDYKVPVVKRSSKVLYKGKGIGKYQPRHKVPYKNKNLRNKGKYSYERLMFREHYRLFIYLYNEYLYGNMTYSEFVAILQLNGIQIDESNAWDSNGTLIFDYDDLEDVPDSIGLHDNGGHVKDSSDSVEKHKPISNSGVIDSGEVVAEVVDVEE